MLERPFIPRLLPRLGILFIVCTTLAVCFSAAAYADYTYRDYDVSWSELLVRALADWWPWVVVGPGVLLLGEAVRFERRRWYVALLVHLPASVVFGAVTLIIKVTVLKAIYDTDGIRAGMGQLAQSILLYWAFVGAVHGLEFQRRYRERALRASQLESQLAHSKLQALRMQLHPHFLFNTLHAVSTLMHRDVDAAERMITRLSDLLRLAIEDDDAHTVPLGRELDFLRRYLDIEAIRFGDRLVVTFDVDPHLLDALVPHLILQPLVENAVRHGISARSAAGAITVSATRDEGDLCIEVTDDGPGFPTGEPPPFGVGLANTAARLHELYGDDHGLAFTSGPGGGAGVRLSLPLERAPGGDGS